ncbi:hypothetical protein T484DRAFT_1809178 [Baffinella frigidus]|nr:hypothetical protein T484DRAFT_1809178 [Cryptophyta sp. CCMP2293]
MDGSCGAGCGDGGKNGIEECDDDANVNGDGCDASCRLETGWACASNEAGGLTSGCATTCGDGVKAGVEECDSGSDNSDTGHGCRADCTMAATAVCTENEAQLSTCRLCGNGKREAGETCDDSFSSGGCLLAGACQATTPGYLCSGGDLATADKCVSGPATAPAPVMSTATTSYELAWEAVSGVTSGNTSGVATGAGTTTLLKITSLAAAPAMYGPSLLRKNPDAPQQRPWLPCATRAIARYRAQVRGCTTAGCGTYSPWSPGAAITAKAATESLTAMASVITQDPKLLVTGLDVTVGNITSKAPEPEPVAPTSANDASVINETAILLANLPAPVVVVVPDPTTSTTPAATTTPAETSIVEEETTSTPAPVVETSIVEEETTSTPAPVVEVTTTPTAAVPTTPTVAVPTTTPVALPTTPTVALPTTPTVALPTTTPVALPTTTTPVAVPTTPTVAVPTTPTVAVPTTPAVAVTTAAVAATVVTPAATPAPIVYAPTVSPPVVVPATTTTMVDATIETAVLLSSGAGVVIPAGSLMGNIAVSVTEVADPPAVPAAKAAEMTLSSKVLYFGPTGTTFTTPVKLVLSYTTPASAGLRLAVHRYNTVTLDWDEKPGSKVDAATSTVSVETNSFSSYGIFAVAPLPQETTPRPEGLPQWALLALTIGVPLVALLLIVLAIFALLRCCASPQTDSKVDTSHDAAGQLASRAGMHQVRVLGGDGVTAAFPAEGHVPANGSGILYAGSANGSGILYGGYAQPSTAAVAFAITQGPSSPPLRAMAQRGSISLPPLSPRSALPATRMAAWKLPPLSQGLAPRGAATTSFQDVEVSASPSANLDPGYVAARPHGPLGGRPGQEWALSSITSSISHADARRLASGGGDEGGGVFSIPGSANQENPYTAANWHAQVIAHAQAQEARAQEQTPAQAQDQAEAQYHAGVQAQYAAAPTQGHEAQAEARREPDPPPRAASRLADSSEALPENFFSGDAVWG